MTVPPNLKPGAGHITGLTIVLRPDGITQKWRWKDKDAEQEIEIGFFRSPAGK